MNAPNVTRPTAASRRWAPRPTRLTAVAIAVALAVPVVLVGMVSAAAQPAPPTTPTPAPPTTTAPHLPGGTVAPSLTSTPSPSRWVQPPTPSRPVPPSTSPTPIPAPSDSTGGGSEECGVSDIGGCVAMAIDGFFARLVETSLNRLLDLVGHTLLTTPEPGELPHVGGMWDRSWQIVLAVYGLVVMAAGVLLMVRETLQTRYSIRELAPRLVVGFVAGAMSMLIATTAIGFANALAQTIAGDGVEPDSAGAALTRLASTGGNSQIFSLLLMLALAVMLLVLLIAYVVRVAVTIVLVVAAPLALMCHALPGLDGIARWWWRSFAACLSIQVVQSLILVTVLRVFLTPGGWGFFGPNADGIADLIVALALMGVLIKTPWWLLSVLRIGQGRSFVGSLARGFIAYKTLGLLRGASGGGGAPATAKPPSRRAPRAPAGPRDPFARTRATRDGQLMLPLEGVRRVPRRRAPEAEPAPKSASAARPTPARAPRGRQLAFDFTPPAPPDPYKGVRPGRDGQYPLPIRATRVKPTPPPEPARPPSTPAPRKRRPEQLAFDFDTAPPAPADPYARVRPSRSGQYPLPFPVARVKPTPPPPTPPQPPPPPAARRSVGRQLHLPLPDLPVRRRAPRAPRGGKLR